MTQEQREQAIEVLQAKIDSIEDDQAYSQLSKSMYEDGYRRIDACKAAIAALRGPEPDPATGLKGCPFCKAMDDYKALQTDPITGLVPCGCGGNARIKHDSSYSSKCIVKNADETVRYESATVVYPGHTHAWVDCDNNKCRCSVGYCGGLIFRTDEEARDAWNVAMGYTAPPLPGAIGPDATPFGFERIGGDWEETAE